MLENQVLINEYNAKLFGFYRASLCSWQISRIFRNTNLSLDNQFFGILQEFAMERTLTF